MSATRAAQVIDSADTAARQITVRRESLWSKAIYKFRRDGTGMFALAVVVVYSLIAAGVWLGWLATDWADVTGGKWEAASFEHWFGTNIIGQDIFSRAIYSTSTGFRSWTRRRAAVDAAWRYAWGSGGILQRQLDGRNRALANGCPRLDPVLFICRRHSVCNAGQRLCHARGDDRDILDNGRARRAG